MKSKANEENGPWRYFLHNPIVYQLAHDHAGEYLTDENNLFPKRKGVDIQHFRTLLIHLFAISILWLHFKKADEFLLANDAYNYLLNPLEFKLGLRSFCAAYGHEIVTDEELENDFCLLDTNEDGRISFLEVKTSFFC